MTVRPKRKAITERMKIDCLLDRSNIYGGAVQCDVCFTRIIPGDRIEWDHVHPLCADGPHIYANIRPLHYDCHKEKTKRDVALNAKAKRIASGGRKRKGPPMKSRPFQKKPKGYKYRLSKKRP